MHPPQISDTSIIKQYAPLPNPLKCHLNIEQYNEVWFSGQPPSTRPSYPAKTVQPAALIGSLNLTPFPSLTSMEALPVTTATPSLAPASAPTPVALASALASSSDKLLNISYLPAGTARPCWYLVCVEDTALSQLLTLIASTLPHRASTMSNSCCSTPPPTKPWAIHAAASGHNGINSLQAPSTASWIMVTSNSSLPLVSLTLPSALPSPSLFHFRIHPAIFSALSISNLAFSLLIDIASFHPTTGITSFL